jgi:hypothetical protein
MRSGRGFLASEENQEKRASPFFKIKVEFSTFMKRIIWAGENNISRVKSLTTRRAVTLLIPNLPP